MPTVFIPPSLRPLTGGAAQVAASGTNVRRLIDDLETRFPGIRDRLCDGQSLRSGLAVAIDGSISSLGLIQKVPDQCEVHFLPALGGG